MQPYPFLHTSLSEIDADTFQVIEFEKRRQERKIILIASESACPQAVLEAQGSVFSNIYAEGYPSVKMSIEEREEILNWERHSSFYRRYSDRRHYKGCDYANLIEALAQLRCSKIFAHKDEHITVNPEDIFVNVQALSGAAANNAVYQALVKPGDTIMGMALSHGGHLTHGSPFNRSGQVFNVVSYEVDLKTGHISYEQIEELAKKHRPKIIIGGASAYPWDVNWKRLREIADEVGAMVLADISHTSGLAVCGLYPNPVGYAHVTTSTTHKTLCGPRAAIILTTDRKLAKKIDKAVFPGEQGGPHINTIAGLSVAFKLAATKEFQQLMKQVVKNCASLAEGLKKRGLELAYGGSNTHMCLIDLRKIKKDSGVILKGDVASNILDLCGVTCNKNTIAGDVTAADSSAIRLGTTWVTQLGMGPEEMDKIAEIIHLAVTNIKTYNTITKAGVKNRGKLSLSIMREIQQKVFELMHREEHPDFPKYPHYFAPQNRESARQHLLQEEKDLGKIERDGISLISHIKDADAEWKTAQEKAVMIHSVENGLIEVSGERSEAFLTNVISANPRNIEEAKGICSLLLDGDGKIIADIRLFPNGKNKYLIICPAHCRETVKEWLRNLSDGYIIFENEFLNSKIPGPVIVKDLYEHSPAMTSLTLVGPNSGKILSQLEGSVEKLEKLGILSFLWKEKNIFVTRTNFSKDAFEIYIELEILPEFVKKLKEIDPELSYAGESVLDHLRKEANFCLDKKQAESIDKATLCKNFADYISPEKPYFIGQSYLKEHLATPSKTEHVFKLYEGEPRYTNLAKKHNKLTNRALVPFAGWWMPILYTSILEEHKAVRTTAGLFDVTHMGVLEVKGEGACRFLQILTSNDVEKMHLNQAQYSYLIDPAGNVIDDIMIYRQEKEKFMVVVNAANAEKDLEWIQAVACRKVIIDPENPQKEMDVSPIIRDLRDPKSGEDMRVDLALQGPTSQEILLELAGNDENLKKQIKKLKKSYFLETQIDGMNLMIARSGYTGEKWGYELYAHPDSVAKLWGLLLEKGEKFGIVPTGLGARDSTRTEAGFPLYGHELSGEHDITPAEAGYGSFVKNYKTFFIGQKALWKKDEKSKSSVARFELVGKGLRAIRPGSIVFNKKGQVIGYVTSCTFVEQDHQIGLAYIKNQYIVPKTEIGILNIPKKDSAPKAIGELKMGNKFPVPDWATIITRFPKRKKS